MAYFNLAGLLATQQAESGGNYTAQNPGSSASGAYQFLDGTWNQYQTAYNNQYGTNYNYPSAYLAPPAVQDQVASITPVSNWGGSWAGSGGANAANAAYIQSTPLSSDDLSGLGNYQEGYTGNLNAYEPDYSTSSAIDTLDSNLSGLDDAQLEAALNATGNASTGWGNSMAGVGNAIGGQGGGSETLVGAAAIQQGATAAATSGVGAMTTTALGLTSGLGNAVSDWVKGLSQSIVQGFNSAAASVLGPTLNYAMRGGIIIVGVVLILAAIWIIAAKEGPKVA